MPQKYPGLTLFFTIAFLVMAGCESAIESTDLPMETDPIAITWGVVDHLEKPDSFLSELVIKNNGPESFGNEGWALYFNFIRLIKDESVPDAVRITHINGDFYKLEPTASFPILAPGDSIQLPFEASAWAVKVTDGPSGFYLVMEDANGDPQPSVIIKDYTIRPFVTPAQTMRNVNDNLMVPTPASRYAANEALTLLPEDALSPVLPTPLSWKKSEGEVVISAQTSIQHESALENEASYLAEALGKLLGEMPQTTVMTTNDRTAIRLVIADVSANLPNGYQNDEAYTLAVDPASGITVTGQSASGVFYGIQSLRALISPDAYQTTQEFISVPAISVSDAPRFPYRGMHLDVARNFQQKESVLKLLELMAFYKLNAFHFHITDDEGWRLEIPGLPELTDIGGRRGHTLDESDHLIPSLGSGPNPDQSFGSGYYTRNDFIEILQYAHARHIDVIPEIDMPGHARAAIVAMNARATRLSKAGDANAAMYLLTDPGDTSEYMSVQLWNDNVVDVCRPSTYAFLRKVVDELVSMYADAGVPFNTLHTGGDEVPHGVWTGSPACKALDGTNLHNYFLTNFNSILADHNLTLVGWEEIALSEQIINGQVTKAPNPVFSNSNFVPYVWNTVWGWGGEANAYRLANAGYKVVLSNATNLYFDLSYDKDPQEPGFYWADFVDTYKAFSFAPLDLYQGATQNMLGHPIDAHSVYRNHTRLTPRGRQNVLGIQGQLWSERAYGEAGMMYAIFPKLFGLAERAWAAAPAWATVSSGESRSANLATDWNQFANRLGQRELPRLDGIQGGIPYRIPPPGAVIKAGRLYANTAFPGLTLHYTTDGNEPTTEDPVYGSESIDISGPVMVRAFSKSGRGSRASAIN